MSKVVLITNIPSPYRVDLFYYMQKYVKEHEFFVIYTSNGEDNRSWSISSEKMLNTEILKSRVIKIKGKIDNRYIHLPDNISIHLANLNPDIIIAWEYNPAALQALLWAKMHKKKFIHLTDGTIYSERNIGFIQKLSRKIICKNADACIASSTKAKEKLLHWKVDERKIFISLLTMDVDKYLHLERNPIKGRILYVGSMVKRKGLDLLILALSNVDVDFSLHIVGNGTKEEIGALKGIIAEKGLDKNVVFCGFKEGQDLLEEYSQADVFVLPTREDCFGLVLVEALCAKLPIVASKYADGAFDTIEEGVNGYIVDPYDEKMFGEKIAEALTNNTIVEGAKNTISEQFSFANVTEGYLKAIEYVLKGK